MKREKGLHCSKQFLTFSVVRPATRKLVWSQPVFPPKLSSPRASPIAWPSPLALALNGLGELTALHATHCSGWAIFAHPTGEANFVGREEVDDAEEESAHGKEVGEGIVDAKKRQSLPRKKENNSKSDHSDQFYNIYTVDTPPSGERDETSYAE